MTTNIGMVLLGFHIAYDKTDSTPEVTDWEEVKRFQMNTRYYNYGTVQGEVGRDNKIVDNVI